MLQSWAPSLGILLLTWMATLHIVFIKSFKSFPKRCNIEDQVKWKKVSLWPGDLRVSGRNKKVADSTLLRGSEIVLRNTMLKHWISYHYCSNDNWSNVLTTLLTMAVTMINIHVNIYYYASLDNLTCVRYRVAGSFTYMYTGCNYAVHFTRVEKCHKTHTQ